MAQIEYQGYARDRGFKPVQVSTAGIGKIAQQGESLARQMKDNRQTENQNRQEFLGAQRSAQELEQRNKSENFGLSTEFRKNFQQNVLQNQKVRIDNAENSIKYRELDSQVQALGSLAKFSTTIGKMVVDWNKAKNEEDRINEYVHIRTNGLDPKEELIRTAGKDHIRKVDETIQTGADKLMDAGAPPELVMKARKMSPGAALGRAQAITEMAVEGYSGWLTAKLAEDDETQVQYVDPDTGEVKVITPKGAIGRDQTMAATSQLFKQYIKEKGLLGISPAFWADGLKTMKGVENKLIEKEGEAHIKADNEERLAAIMFNLDRTLGQDPVLAANEAMRQLGHARDDNGVRFSPLKSFQTVMKHLVTKGDMASLEALAQSESYMKGVPWEEAREADFNEARIQIETKAAEHEALQDRITDQKQENWSDDAVAQLVAIEGGADEAVVQQVITASREMWNGYVDPRLETYANNLTLQAVDLQEQRKTIEDLISNDQLTVEELDSNKYNWKLRTDPNYRKAAEAGSRAAEAETKGYRDQYKKGLSDALMQNAGMEGYADKKAIPTFHFAEAHALKQLDKKAAVLFQSGKAKTLEEAYSMAAQEVIVEIQNDRPKDGKEQFGTYAFSGKGEFRRWGSEGSGASGLTKEAKERVSLIRSKIANGGVASITGEKLLTIEQAQALDNPEAPVPEIIQIMANALPKGKHMTVFDIIDAQRNVHGLPPRQRPYIQQQVEGTLTPGLMELLNRYPTGMRTRRGLVGGQLVGPGQDRQAVNMIAQGLGVDPVAVATFINYESAGSLVNGQYRGGLDRWGGGSGATAGTYLGWIQFSPDNQKKYGVRPGMSATEHAQAVIKYLKDSGVRPGDGIEAMYQAIQAPSLMGDFRRTGKLQSRDTNDTVENHVKRMKAEHGKLAKEWLMAGAPASPYRDPRIMSPAARRAQTMQVTQDGRALFKRGQNTGIQITSANDASGEPGSDFVVEDGKRGANFYFPYKAKVVKVVNNDNREFHKEKGQAGRGYGNYVDLEVVLPGGIKADVRLAHFDSVNAGLKEGQPIPPNLLIGTQGRTGSTSGPHVSADWYYPGTTKPFTQARDIFLQQYLRKNS